MQYVVGITFGNAHAERLQAGANTRHGAVMVAALLVDDVGEAPLPLADVIRDIRHEVRVGTIALAHHPVLVIAKTGGLEPQRAFMLMRHAVRTQLLRDRVDLAIGVER